MLKKVHDEGVFSPDMIKEGFYISFIEQVVWPKYLSI